MGHQFASVVNGVGALVTGTPSVQADTVAERDSNGDLLTNVFYGSKGVRSAGHLYLLGLPKSANFTVDESSNNATVYPVTTGASAITVTLPAASTVAGKIIGITKADTGAGTVVIDGDSAETVQGKAQFTLYTYGDTVFIQSTGTAWIIVDIAMSPAVIAKSADFTADDQPFTEFVYIVTTGSAVTATLPAVSGLKGRRMTFKRVSASNNLVIDGSGSETIDGATTKTNAAQYSVYSIVCDGSAWHTASSLGTWT